MAGEFSFETMQRLLDQARGRGEQAEVLSYASEDTPVSFEANRLKLLQARESSGIALRIVHQGRIGLAATNRPDAVDSLVDTAIELSQFGAEAKFTLPGRRDYPAVAIYDPAIEGVTVEQMVEMGQRLIDRLRAHNGELVCSGGVTKVTSDFSLINSHGARAGYRKSVFSIGVSGVWIRGTDMLYVGDGDSATGPIADYMRLADESILQLERAKTNATVTSKPLPVIFTSDGAASALVGPLSMAFNGRTVLQGASPLVGKLGQQLLDPRVSFWDDPLIEQRPGSSPSDDEGLPRRRNALVENGVVQQFLYDLQTAGLAGTESTGSASRGLDSLPGPSLSTMVWATGDTTFDDMLADVKEGLVIESLMGAGQGNVLGGDFSANVLLGYKVENGQIVGRVKDTVVAGNVYDLLKHQIAAIGSEPRWVGGGLYLPPLYLRNVSVSAKG